MWIRLEVDWQTDPFVVTLDGAARHILNTVWCLAGRRGSPTFDSDGQPEHAELDLQYLEPGYLARESGFDVATVRASVEKLRRALPRTDWSPEVPAPISVDPASGLATVRNVGKFQRNLLKDRYRKRQGGSTEPPRSSTEPPRSLRGKTPGNGRNGRNETNSTPDKPSPAPPSGDAVEVSLFLADAVRCHSPAAKVNPKRWARDIDLAIRLDGRTLDQLRAVIDYAHRDPKAWARWKHVIRSGENLRKHFDTVDAQRTEKPRAPPTAEARQSEARAALDPNRTWTP